MATEMNHLGCGMRATVASRNSVGGFGNKTKPPAVAGGSKIWSAAA